MPRHKPPTQKKNSFPVWMFVGAAVLVVAGVAIWFTQQTNETYEGKIGPRLSLSTERIDLGKQPFDKMVRAEFKVTNTGDAPLNLDAKTPIRVIEGC